MQMNKNEHQFIINLVKLPQGYSFESLQEPINSTNKKKNPPKDKNKNTTKTIHRIFRELALDPQQPQEFLNPQIEEPEPPRRLLELEPDEEISVELKRENGLPESPVDWFKEDQIHQIEKDSLPEFFRGNTYKTEGLYLKYRNFIVALYKKSPNEYLTKIACRRMLRGDVNTILKIHSFLEREGIINFGLSKEGNYTFCPTAFQKAVNEDAKNSLPIDGTAETDEEKTVDPIDITNITVTTVNKSFSKSNRVFCNKCESICGILWYKKEDETGKVSSLCIQCFQTLPENEAKEFVKIDIVKKIDSQANQSAHDNKNVWSIDDNLKLLHFTSHPDENWKSLEESFDKKKTLDDIILQFMQFPISNLDYHESRPTPSVLKDEAESHAINLVKRLNASSYGGNKELKKEAENLNNEVFTKNMLDLTKSFCSKLEVNINSNIKLESQIEAKIFELNAFKVLSKKKIQNQQPTKNEIKSNKEREYNEENISSEGEPEEFQDNQDLENENNEGDKGFEIEDFMNNLAYH